jgi:hypothetical protein
MANSQKFLRSKEEKKVFSIEPPLSGGRKKEKPEHYFNRKLKPFRVEQHSIYDLVFLKNNRCTILNDVHASLFSYTVDIDDHDDDDGDGDGGGGGGGGVVVFPT